jgi:hypothetical protein
MTLIALEEHVLPADLVDQLWPTPMALARLPDLGVQQVPPALQFSRPLPAPHDPVRGFEQLLMNCVVVRFS